MQSLRRRNLIIIKLCYNALADFRGESDCITLPLSVIFQRIVTAYSQYIIAKFAKRIGDPSIKTANSKRNEA